MKILNLDNWCEEALEVLSNVRLLHTSKLYDAADMTHVYNDFEGIISNLAIKMDEKRLKYFPNLKFIASPTTGLDHIDTEYAKSKDIDIISLQGETEFLKGVYATAEHTMALILSLVRRIPAAHNHVIEGGWDRERFRGAELHGNTLGIVGYGRVGRQVDKFAQAFGMRCAFYDPYIKMAKQVKWDNNEQWMDFVLTQSDIITAHVPLNSETKDMFGKEQFSMMKPTAFFVNTSRGGIVDEEALIWALENKIIAGAALDVAQNEPNPWPRLLHYASKHDNLLLTCHIAGNTQESRKKTQIHIANRIVEYIKKHQRSVNNGYI